MPRFLLSYRVPEGYQPSAETRTAWQAWFDGLGTSLAELGHGVLAMQTIGCTGGDTRLGGYSVVTAPDLQAAADLAAGCPALRLDGGVEIGTILAHRQPLEATCVTPC
jgi:hypothetical protein